MGKWVPIVSMGATIPLYGGAGRFEFYLEPFRTSTTMTPLGMTNTNVNFYRSTASVASMNPVGGKFTLPRSFVDHQGSSKAYASTAFPGYTSFSYLTFVNGKGVFRPKNPFGATKATRVVFPTTMGNPAPNLGAGAPVTPTSTFGGRYDFSRAGSILIQPGPNRFGGTMRLLSAPTSLSTSTSSRSLP